MAMAVLWTARRCGDRRAAELAQRVMAYGLHLGARLPVHATSTGCVLLASMSAGELSAWLKGRVLPRLTPHTLTQAKLLRQRIAQVRADDFCIASEEHELGVQALAGGKLRNMQGRTVAALNLVLSGGSAVSSRAHGGAITLLFEVRRSSFDLVITASKNHAII